MNIYPTFIKLSIKKQAYNQESTNRAYERKKKTLNNLTNQVRKDQ